MQSVLWSARVFACWGGMVGRRTGHLEAPREPRGDQSVYRLSRGQGPRMGKLVRDTNCRERKQNHPHRLRAPLHRREASPLVHHLLLDGRGHGARPLSFLHRSFSSILRRGFLRSGGPATRVPSFQEHAPDTCTCVRSRVLLSRILAPSTSDFDLVNGVPNLALTK